MAKKILKNLWVVVSIFIFSGLFLAATTKEDFSLNFKIGMAVIVFGGIITLLMPKEK